MKRELIEKSMELITKPDKSGSFIREIEFLDSIVYPIDFRGTYDSIKSRFDKFKDSYIIAKIDGKIVGYLCFFPVSRDLAFRLENESHFFDDDISKDDIEWYENNNILFIISLVVHPDYQRKGISKKLICEFEKIIGDLKSKIKSIYAITINPISYKILLSNGFHAEKELQEGKTLMRRDLIV